MCRDCLRTEEPERGKTCYDTGAYMANFKGCAACKEIGRLEVEDKKTVEEDGEEITTFRHVCPCGHDVATHTYTFQEGKEYQEYTMECALCGSGMDSQKIDVSAPKK